MLTAHRFDTHPMASTARASVQPIRPHLISAMPASPSGGKAAASSALPAQAVVAPNVDPGVVRWIPLVVPLMAVALFLTIVTIFAGIF